MSHLSTGGARLVRRILLAGTVIIVMAGGSALGAEVDDPRVVVSELIAQAELGLAQATTLGHAWTVTQPLIDAATAMLQAGDMVRAAELAERALATAVASIEQANLEAQAWRSRVPQ